MLQTIANAFAVPEIRRKIFFTLGMLALYRLGAYIPAPGIDIDTLDSIESNFTGNNVLGFLNLFSGGSLQRLIAVRARDHALHHGLDHPAAADRGGARRSSASRRRARSASRRSRSTRGT